MIRYSRPVPGAFVALKFDPTMNGSPFAPTRPTTDPELHCRTPPGAIPAPPGIPPGPPPPPGANPAFRPKPGAIAPGAGNPGAGAPVPSGPAMYWPGVWLHWSILPELVI